MTTETTQNAAPVAQAAAEHTYVPVQREKSTWEKMKELGSDLVPSKKAVKEAVPYVAIVSSIASVGLHAWLSNR